MITSETAYFEIVSKPSVSKIKCIVLDYDGTLTTLRKGWDIILSSYARSKINPYNLECGLLEERIADLTRHAGGTTPKQLMTRLMSIIAELQLIPDNEVLTLEEYARDYADHFQDKINDRLADFSAESEGYVIQSVRPMLDFISKQKTYNYIVTGSCENAVKKELLLLDMIDKFERIYGATLEMEGNLKLNAMKEIMENHNLMPGEILVIGDGSTEIRAAAELGLPAIGIASDEHTGGLCSNKRSMLIDLGAHAIISDYTGFQRVWDWLHVENA